MSAARSSYGSTDEVLYEEWMRARKLRDTSKSPAKSRAYYVLADSIQYLLESTPEGRRLVRSAR